MTVTVDVENDFRPFQSWQYETEQLYDAIVPACRGSQHYVPAAIPTCIYQKNLFSSGGALECGQRLCRGDNAL